MKHDKNSDGSITVKLDAPVKVRGDETQRLTIPALKGKHMRMCPFELSKAADIKLGQIVDFAALIVEPLGCIDELSPKDAIAVASLVAEALFPKESGEG